MRRTSRSRPTLEQLEDRCCPSVVASAPGGTLNVTGSTMNLQITEVAPDQFQVLDGTTDRGTFAVSHDVNVILATLGNNQVTLDLHGNTAPGNVNIVAGQGGPSVSVFGGTIAGNLRIIGGAGSDTVELGGQAAAGPSAPLTAPPTPTPSGASLLPGPGPASPRVTGPGLHVLGNTYVQMGDDPLDTVRVDAGVSLDGALTASQVGQVDLRAASSVGGNVTVMAGRNGVKVLTNGAVHGSLLAGGLAGTGHFLYLGPLGSVGGDLTTSNLGSVQLAARSTVAGSASVAGAGSVTAAGTVGRDLTLQSGGTAPQTLNVQGTAAIHGNLSARMGDGTDTVNLLGKIGGNLGLQTGAGNDQVTLGGTVAGNATVGLGVGNDTFTFTGVVGTTNGAPSKLLVDPGTGKDSVKLAGKGTGQVGSLAQPGGSSGGSVFVGNGSDPNFVGGGFLPAPGTLVGSGTTSGDTTTFPSSTFTGSLKSS